jgi:hypothetical protein
MRGHLQLCTRARGSRECFFAQLGLNARPRRLAPALGYTLSTLRPTPTPAGKGRPASSVAALQHMHPDELTVNSGCGLLCRGDGCVHHRSSAASTRLGKLLAAAFKEGIPRTA